MGFGDKGSGFLPVAFRALGASRVWGMWGLFRGAGNYNGNF